MLVCCRYSTLVRSPVVGSMPYFSVLCYLALVSAVRAVTIDEQEVIVRGPPSNHANDTDDLFGYSAALHSLVNPAESGSNFKSIIRSARILVGVPNGTTTGHRVEQTGYVLECPLSPGPCAPLRGSGEGNDTLLYDETSNKDDEEKKEQFLGVAMESRNGGFAVCGHRWLYRRDSGSSREPQGKCLVSGRSLRDFQLVKPCTPGANSQLLSAQGGQNGFNSYCLSGTDVTFLDDGSLAIGAPGYQAWTGAGFVYGGSGMSPVTVASGDSLVSYGGMSVGQARVTNTDKSDWIMSAPRANKLFGQVHIFTPDVGAAQSRDQIGAQLGGGMFTLTGSQIGAYFGYSVEGVDFNGDGFDDVLIGAPLFFKGSSLPEVGAVYIYENIVTNNIGSVMDNRRMALTAPGGGVAYSRFGHAIAPLGDLDDDGFEDVAISAPFGQGLSGTVYIYRGSRQGIVTTPAQTLVGSELNLVPSAVSGLTSFGAYLSASTDIDGNQYNDLIIGAFMSRKVFVMRSRTVVTIEGKVQPINTSITIGSQRHCPLDQSANHCFQVEYCLLSVRGKGFKEGQLIGINYTLYADNRSSGLQPRATFSSGGSVLLGQVALTVNSNNSWCSEPILYIQTSTSDQLLSPLRPAMTVSVPQGASSSRSDGNQEPTDLTENRIYVRTEGVFSAQVAGNKECLRTLCSVDAYVRGNPIKYISHINPDFRDRFLLVEVVSDIVFSTTVGNTGPEAAYNVRLVFIHPPSLILSRVEEGAQFMCETDQNTTRTVCSTPNGLNSGAQLKVPVRFVIDSSRIDASVDSIAVSVEVQVEDDDLDRANNVHTYQIPVRFSVSPAVFIDLSEDELPIVANVTRSGLPKRLDQIGREVTVSVAIGNDGPSTIGQGRLTIHLPYRTPCTRNAFLLYLHRIHQQHMRCTISPHNALDTLRLSPTDEQHVQRSTQGSNRDAHLEDIPGNCTNADSTVQIICDATIPGCATVVCYVNTHQKGTVHSLLVSAYLDDFFYKDAQTSYKLFFRAVYEEVLANDSISTGTQSATDFVSLLVRKPSNVGVDTPVQTWVIAVPLVAVIVFIVGLTGCLWICGFFKRKSWKTKDSYDFDNEDDKDYHTQDDKYSAIGVDCDSVSSKGSTNEVEGDNGCGSEGYGDSDTQHDKDCHDGGDSDCGNRGDEGCDNAGDKGCDDGGDEGCDDAGDEGCDNGDDEGCDDAGDEGCDDAGDEGCDDGGDEGCDDGGDEGCDDGGDEGCDDDTSEGPKDA